MLIELQGVTSFYGSTPILHGIDLSVKKGECVCVLGRNGVGKTTLIRTIMGLTTRVNGKISILGKDVEGIPTHERSLAGLGYIPQGRHIIGNFTIEENILLGTFARSDRKRVVPDICRELFPYLAANLDKKAGQLSGGQQQQLAIARALATDPTIILLDEPTEGIQPNIVQEIEEMLMRLNREMGLTMILTEQHIKAARSLAHEFVMMDRGRIVERGKIENLTNDVIERHLSL